MALTLPTKALRQVMGFSVLVGRRLQRPGRSGGSSCMGADQRSTVELAARIADRADRSRR
jgi:hypothetical protein